MSYQPPSQTLTRTGSVVPLPHDFEYEGRPMQQHYRTEYAVVYQQIPPAGKRENFQPAPLYKFLVFRIERDGEAEVLGDLILTTTSFTQAMDFAAKQE